MDQKTIDTYNKLALEYDAETVDFWELFPRTFLDRFIELSGPRTLNVGSGPGRDGLLLQEAGKDVTCIDASEEMVRLSTARGLRSALGNFESLPFENESFDAVWSYTSLLHVPKQVAPQALAEISRVLTPGGIFALGLIEGDTESYKESSGVNLPRWFSYYQKDEVTALAEAHGFAEVYFESFFPHSKNYLNFIFKKT